MEDLSAIPVLRPQQPSFKLLYEKTKRLFDLTVGGTLLVLTLPMWAVVAALIRVDSPGPVFFVHERLGKEGRRFRLFKFRTMRVDTDPYLRSPDGDDQPHITRVGRVLRATGIDELPQLLNVIRGEMSLVGPRPEMPFIVESYSPLERERLSVPPGITGLWQLSADRHTQIEENIEYDLYYVRHRSFLLDILVLLETVLFTVGQAIKAVRRGARRPTGPPPSEIRTEESGELPVFVAFDQRRLHSDSDHLKRWLGVVEDLSSHWPVKLLTAAGNASVFDSMLLSPQSSGGGNDRMVHYVPYLEPAHLTSHLRAAALVVTDMEHLAALAKRQNVTVVSPASPERQYQISNSDNGEMVSAALDALKSHSISWPSGRKSATGSAAEA